MPAAASSRVARFSTASDDDLQLDSKRVSPTCWNRVTNPGDPVVLCCALLFGVFFFLSTVFRNSVVLGGADNAASGLGGSGGGPEGFVPVEQKVFKQGAAAEELASHNVKFGGMKDAVSVLQTEKRKLHRLKKNTEQLERAQSALHVDHAKQQVLEERSRLDKEEKAERKEEDAVHKEKTIIKKLRSDLEAEEKLFDKLGQGKDKDSLLGKAEKLEKDEKLLEEAEKKQVVQFNKVHAEETKKDQEVKEVASTWSDIKARHGASKNIEFKHMKEEKRHSKIRKKAIATLGKFTALQATHEELAKKEAELQHRLRDAKAGTAL